MLLKRFMIKLSGTSSASGKIICPLYIYEIIYFVQVIILQSLYIYHYEINKLKAITSVAINQIFEESSNQ